MADPFSLSTQYQDRLDNSTKALDELPRYFLEGTRLPGVMANNRLLKVQAAEAESALTVSQQLQKAVQDPHGIMGEFGDLTTAAEMRKFMARHAAISVSPVGKNLLGIFDKIATATQEAEKDSIGHQTALAIARKRAEKTAAMIESGVDVENPEEVMAFAKNESLLALDKQAHAREQIVDPNEIQDSDWLPGGLLKPEARVRLLANAKPLPHISAANERSAELIASRETMARELADLRRDLLATKTDADLDALQMKLENNLEVQGLRNLARVAVAEGQVSREQFVNRQLHQTSNRIAESKEGRKMTPEQVNAKAMKLLGESFDQEIASRRAGPVDDLNSKRNRIKADFNAGTISKEESLKRLRATGLK